MGCGATKISPEKSKRKKTLPFNKDSKICIVGAGAGGLHMAYSLKKKGFNNIKIIEKEPEIGGKANTITVDSYRYDTGTVLTYSDPNVINLLKEVDLYNEMILIDAKETEIYSKKSQKLLQKLPYAKEVTGVNNLIKLKILLDKQLEIFGQIYKMLTDKYGFPREEYMKEMTKKVTEFFEDHNLTLLNPLIESRLKSQGYDRGDMILFNSLFFLDPKYLKSDAILLQFKPNFGWQDIWLRLVEKWDLNVQKNMQVESIEYLSENSNLKVTLKDLTSSNVTEEIYDFVIIANPEPLKLLKNPSYLQKEYLEKQKNFCPVVTSIYKIKNKHKKNLLFDKESIHIKNKYVGGAFYRKVRHNEEDVVDVAYLYFKKNHFIEEKDLKEIEANLSDQVEFLIGERIKEIVHTKINNKYLPHCSVEDIKAGVPWEIFKLQGENKIWFTSAFTCFDLTQAIINYNMKLLDEYEF